MCSKSLISIRYDKACTRAALSAIPDFHFCLNPACESGQIHAMGTEEPIFHCNECGNRHCVVCNLPWHEGQLCPESEERRRTNGTQAQEDHQATAEDWAHQRAWDAQVTTKRLAEEAAKAQIEACKKAAKLRDRETEQVQQEMERQRVAAAEKQRRLAEQRQDEIASAKTVAAISKQCPSCHSKIERNGGCDHMTCELFSTLATICRSARMRMH